MKSFFVLLITIFVLFSAVRAFFPLRVDPLVQTEQGLVRGVKSSDGNYSMYLGLAYAQVDFSNPFGPALSAPSITGVFEAYHGTIQCPQMSLGGVYTGSLDCLRLNIFVPNDASIIQPAPVLIWVHGGKFKSGSISETDPGELVKQGIVVVTINYRLGVYGFMCLDTPSVPGNQGLKDQLIAFKWVNANIIAFGGNPNKVTIAGQNAGSCSVLYHLYSKHERFYRQVIAQSGTPLNEGMFGEKDTEAAIKIANYIGSDTTDTEDALEVLNSAYPSLIVAAANELNLVLRPCKENVFNGVIGMITDSPFVLSNKNKVKRTSIMIGHTSKEQVGALFQEYGNDYLRMNPFYEKIRNNFKMNIKDIVKAAQFVRKFYIGDDELAENALITLEDFDSDFVYAHSVHRTVTNLLKQTPMKIYQYMFSYSGESENLGAGHLAELEYLFHSDECMSNKDQLMADRVTTLWANFIKFGNPTPLSLIWKPITNTSRYYLDINNTLKQGRNVFKQRMAFWDLFYEMYGKYHIFNKINTEQLKKQFGTGLVFLKRNSNALGFRSMLKTYSSRAEHYSR